MKNRLAVQLSDWKIRKACTIVVLVHTHSTVKGRYGFCKTLFYRFHEIEKNPSRLLCSFFLTEWLCNPNMCLKYKKNLVASSRVYSDDNLFDVQK